MGHPGDWDIIGDCVYYFLLGGAGTEPRNLISTTFVNLQQKQDINLRNPSMTPSDCQSISSLVTPGPALQ